MAGRALELGHLIFPSMALLTSRKTQPSYDVIVVGSGAAGGQTAYTLAMEGVKVLMLEAGRDYDPVRETPMFQTAMDAPLRDAGTPDKPFGFHDATVDGEHETDDDLWRRRLYAVKDELVRLGVPANRIRQEGNGPYLLTVRSNQPQQSSSRRQRAPNDIDAVPDPMATD